MAEMVLKVEGATELLANFKKLQDDKLINNAMRAALRKGAIIIRNQVKANALRIDDPASREMIAKNVIYKNGGSQKERREGGAVIRVGILGGAKPLKKGTDTGTPGGNTTHWRFIEFGTSEARAQPFMLPAAQSHAQAAVTATAAAAWKTIDKELTKAGIAK